MKEGETYGERPTFEAISDFSLDHAIHEASLKAQDYFRKQGRNGKIYLEIVRQEVAIGNPHISEYRIRLAESGGG